MKQRGGKKKGLMTRILVTLGLTVFLLQLPLFFLNSRTVQQWALNRYHPFAPWEMSVESVKFRPFRFQLEAENIDLRDPKGSHIHVKHITARFRPLWLLLKGELVIDPLKIEEPRLDFAHAAPKAKKPEEKKALKLKTLLLLKNLILKRVPITDLRVTWANDKSLSADRIDLQLKPTLFKGTQLGLTVSNFGFQNGEKAPLTFRSFSLNADTRLDNWSRRFPYVNDINGVLSLGDFAFQKAKIDSLKAAVQYRDLKINSREFTVVRDKRSLLGELETDLKEESFRLKLHTPETIPLPRFGGDDFPFDFSGDLKADLELTGKGYKPDVSSGQGSLMAEHRFHTPEDFDPESPAQVAARFHWEKGSLQIDQGDVRFGESLITAAGGLRLKPFDLDLQFQGKNFPSEIFFHRFEEKNLRPIFGKTDFTSTLTGIGKTIRFQLEGNVTEAGYLIFRTDSVHANLDVTHNKLLLNGTLSSHQQETGDARLEFDFSPTQRLQLQGAIRKQRLEETAPGYPFSGEVTASVAIDGAPATMEGDGNFQIANGSLAGQGFEKLSGLFHFTPKQFKIEEAEVAFPETKGRFKDPLTIDITPSGFRLHGNPVPGFSIDTAWQSDIKQLSIHKISVEEPKNPELKSELRGTFSAAGLNLTAKGKLDLRRLKFVTGELREAEGPAEFDLKIGGSSDNPQIRGFFTFFKNALSVRSQPYAAENLEGTLHFLGNAIETDGLSGQLGNGHFKVLGRLHHADRKANSFDITLLGKDIYFRDPNNDLRLEYDADLRFHGTQQSPKITGSLSILDGRYTKNFKVIDELKQAPLASKEIQQAVLTDAPMRLDLKVKTLGDFVIDNNIGRIELNTNLKISGTEFQPRVSGNVEVTEGEIRYLGFNLDITNGFIEFRERQGLPYLDIASEKELDNAHITARLHGLTNNLAMELGGTTERGIPLEKKDVLSLLTTGVTAAEKTELNTFSQIQLGPEFVAEQVANVLQRPIAKATSLDIVRVETNPTKEGREQHFHLGKRITDRLEVTFQQAMNNENAVQSFAVQYWLTDFLLFKGERSTEDQYHLNIGVRFKSR